MPKDTCSCRRNHSRQLQIMAVQDALRKDLAIFIHSVTDPYAVSSITPAMLFFTDRLVIQGKYSWGKTAPCSH
ncbi:MAG: hypothetical protein KJ804_14505 [Proteobacteria bacterium]|nr:hypothetical protein [Pseudomonadota bacterium]MBU1059521.1 hypothetical protein [Pseudomonadota bacterium]